MKRLVFVTPPPADPGFALAGAMQEVATPAQIEATLGRLLAEENNAAVVVDERLLATVPDERLRLLEGNSRILLLALPAPLGGAEGEDYIRRLLRRVLGYQVRISQ